MLNQKKNKNRSRRSQYQYTHTIRLLRTHMLYSRSSLELIFSFSLSLPLSLLCFACFVQAFCLRNEIENTEYKRWGKGERGRERTCESISTEVTIIIINENIFFFRNVAIATSPTANIGISFPFGWQSNSTYPTHYYI